MSYSVAIDFGTSNTVVAVRRSSGPAELVQFGSDSRIPSAVLVREDGSLLAGPLVLREGELAPERVERTPKREIDQETVWRGRPVLVVDLLATVLGYAYRQARRVFNDTYPEQAFLTCPVRRGSERRQVLREAAARAGLPPVELIDEPVAAAVALASRDSLADVPIDSHVAVYDLGGGTLDIALLRRTASGFEPYGIPGGDERCGGEDIDDKTARPAHRSAS